MTEFLLRLGFMSIQASVITCAVLLLRFVFSKLHIAKKYSIFLWVIPYIAMILPGGIKTPISFWQFTQEGQTKIEQAVNTMPYMSDSIYQVTIDENLLQEMENNRYAPPSLESIESGENLTYENTWGDNAPIPDNGDMKEKWSEMFRNLTVWDVVISIVFSVWMFGVIIFMTCGVISSLRLKKKLVCSLLLKDNIYVADDIKEPFVYGVFAPRIYLPCNLTRDNEYYVVEHEKTHILRKDPIKKVVAFVITGIHWFNPFAYIAFHMMTKDMEMACDEETVQRIGVEQRKDYATALLKLSTKKRHLLIPVAFGEGNVKSRIKNVLKYKKTIKVLAVLATIVILALAVVFLTKPMKKIEAFGSMRNQDVITIPQADNPREIIVTYQGKEYSFEESYYDVFRTFLEELEVYKEELNKSRDEARPAEVVIKVKDSVAYNFDKNMETVWCDNGVKPSMTYELVEPKLAIQFLELKILEWKVTDYPAYSFGFETMDTDICGENGPFLDYADDRYVVFHTIDRFYVYDITKQEIIWSIGCDEILKVEVDAENLKAYVTDISGDAISVYECDIVNASRTFVGPVEVEAFDDFLVTSERVVHDPTVFKTKECVQLSDEKYLYLESGSGLISDLKLVLEDAKGSRTIYGIFSPETYYSGLGEVMQLLTDSYYTEMADVTHDGKMEYILIDVEEIQLNRQAVAYLKVADLEGNILWQAELGLPRAGWNSYYRVETEDGICFMQYLPMLMQGSGEYSYRLFYLNEDGSEVEVATDSVSFLTYPRTTDTETETAIPMDEMVQFAEDVNIYFKNARLLISTVDGALRYQTPSKTYTYEELYQTALESEDIEASKNIKLNITKLQNKYEMTKEAVLSNQVQMKQ